MSKSVVEMLPYTRQLKQSEQRGAPVNIRQGRA